MGDRTVGMRRNRALSGTNKGLLRAILLLAPLLVAASAPDVTLSWTLPAEYADGTPIAPENAARIIVRVYSGPGRNGPWNWIATTSPGATSATLPGPPPGETHYYTVKSVLEGAESVFAAPVGKTGFSVPIPAAMKKIAKRMWANRNRVLAVTLASLGLIAGIAVFARRRRRNGATNR